MEFGKLANVDHIDFSLPEDRLINSKVLKVQDLTIYAGMPIWAHKPLIGKIYSEGTPQNKFLAEYAKSFNTIELNSTHYALPNRSTIENWKEMVPDSFKFCPKIPQNISHRNNFSELYDEVRAFIATVESFENNLGMSFMQLPPSFGPQSISVLETFLRRFPKHIPLAIELRHPDWFLDIDNLGKVLDIFYKYGKSAVITDVAGRRDVLHMGLTYPKLMIRFCGNNLHASDFKRIDDWKTRLKLWVENHLEELYFIFHQPNEENCVELAERFCENLDGKVAGPRRVKTIKQLKLI